MSLSSFLTVFFKRIFSCLVARSLDDIRRQKSSARSALELNHNFLRDVIRLKS